MLGLYIHIPFCKQICSYCDFPKRVPFNNKEIEKYLDRLFIELEKYKGYYNIVDTIYIGGGTPNFLNDYMLELLFKNISRYNIKAKEYSIECNPELITENQAKLFKKYQVNRISLGIQTINQEGIKLLNRHHTKDDISRAVNILKKHNITNINIDLIFGYFFETLEDLKEDLDFVLSLDIKHISAYSLILEQKTLLNRLYRQEQIDDDLVADMFGYLENRLIEAGFNHYEISNYAKDGFESAHNLKYWSKDEYIGVGMGATSYLEHKRITNSTKFYKYLANEDKEIEELSLLDEKKEFIILGLRKIKGINKEEYFNKFNSNIKDDFNYEKLINNHLLSEDDKMLKLTSKGVLLGNLVFEEFL